MKKKEEQLISAEEQEECVKLKVIWMRERKNKKLTQKSFGKTLELSEQSINHVLSGRRAITLKMAHAFAKSLGCSVQDFSERHYKALEDISIPESDLHRELFEVTKGLDEKELEHLVNFAKFHKSQKE